MCVLVGTACSVRHEDPGPTPLLNGIQSRISPDEARRAFNAGEKWHVLDDWSRDKNDTRPPAQIVRVMIEPYADLGVSGAMMLWFFNGQLTSATFFTEDIDRYLQALRDERGVVLRMKAEAHVPPGTVISAGVNATGQSFVTWEDAVATGARRRATGS